MRRISLLVLVMVFVGCKKEAANNAPAHNLPAARAAALGDFENSPLLAYVPEDTPYAFATFKAVPVDYFEKIGAMFKPMMAQMEEVGGAGAEKIRAITDEIGTFSIQRFEELGFSAKARLVVYGLGLYPVFRAEIRDGDKLLAFVERAAGRMGKQLDPPTAEGPYKVWRIDNGDMGILLALSKTEVVGALAPTAELDKQRAIILGISKPAKSLSVERFKEIAKRDGYNAQGVGFLEFERLFALVSASADTPPPAECSTVVHALAQRAPRLTMGYDDFSGRRISFGFVVQLAPDLAAEAKKVAAQLPGLDRVLTEPSMFAVAGAFDLAQARTLASRAATAMREVGRACQVDALAGAADKLDTTAKQPLPPFLDGLTGGVAVLSSVEMGSRGPEQITGWGALQLADTAALLSLAGQQMPDLKLEANSKAQPLPPGIPYKGHVAASKRAVGVGLGADSAGKAVAALSGTPRPSPLMLFRIDYERMFGLMAKIDPSSAALSDVYKMFGTATMQAMFDDRGAVMWMTMEMR